MFTEKSAKERREGRLLKVERPRSAELAEPADSPLNHAQAAREEFQRIIETIVSNGSS